MGKKYERNYLTSVIVRIDFPSPVAELTGSLPNKVSKVATKEFPRKEPRKLIGQKLISTPSEMHMTRVEGVHFYFHGRDNEKILCIAPEFAWIEYKRFDTFEALKDTFMPIVAAFFKEIKDFQVSRLGLRYINNLALDEANPTEWGDYLDDRLLAVFRFTQDPKIIARAFHNLELNYGDMSLRFQYGMPNPDHPAPIRRKLFVLDYDAYYEGPLDENDVERYLTRFHDKIEESFEQSITDKLREEMHERPAAE